MVICRKRGEKGKTQKSEKEGLVRYCSLSVRVQIIERERERNSEQIYFHRGGTLVRRAAGAVADRRANEEDERQRRWGPQGRDSSGESEDGSESEGDSEQHPRT